MFEYFKDQLELNERGTVYYVVKKVKKNGTPGGLELLGVKPHQISNMDSKLIFKKHVGTVPLFVKEHA